MRNIQVETVQILLYTFVFLIFFKIPIDIISMPSLIYPKGTIVIMTHNNDNDNNNDN